MKKNLFRILAGLAMAITAIGAPQAASAAPLANANLRMTYCWSLSSFGPTGCNARWPTSGVTLVGGGSQGPAVYGIGTTNAVTGTFAYSNSGNDLVIRFANPSPSVVSAVYTGTRYIGTGTDCFRGPMTAVRVTGPAMNGVWFGCIVP